MPDALPSIDEIAQNLANGKTPEEAGAATEVPADVSADPATPEATEVTTETKPETEAKPAETADPKKDASAARFAALARREREARALKDAQERRAQEIEAKAKELADAEMRLKAARQNPLELLKEAGLTYADVTAAMLGQHKPKEPDPVDLKLDERVKPLSDDLAELKKAKDEITQALQELQAHRVEIAKREVRQAIEATAKDGGFEYINALGTEAYTLVEDVIAQYYKKHKRILNYNEACDKVERYYEERAQKLLATSKVQSRFASASTPQKTQTPQRTSPPAKESKTLTQSLSQGTRAKPDVDKMSNRDALEFLASTLKYVKD